MDEFAYYNAQNEHKMSFFFKTFNTCGFLTKTRAHIQMDKSFLIVQVSVTAVSLFHSLRAI